MRIDHTVHFTHSRQQTHAKNIKLGSFRNSVKDDGLKTHKPKYFSAVSKQTTISICGSFS